MRRFSFACSLIAVSLLVAIPVRGDFTFVHCSDIHIGAGNNAEADAELFEEIAKHDPRPRFIVNTGDVCETGTDAEYERYQQVIKSLGDVQAYVAPGNHDVRWNPRGKEGYTRGTNGPLYQSWDCENVHFVTLDSTVLLEHWGHISQEQLDWLKSDLEKVGPEKPVVIGFHHWIGREVIQTDNEQQLLELVKPYNVVLWLQGHGHSDIDWNVNGTPATMVKGLYQGSYDLITVNDRELKIRKRAWNDVKKKGEQLQDKDVPEKHEVVWKDLMVIPLKKRPAPKWSAEAKVADGSILVTAQRGELP